MCVDMCVGMRVNMCVDMFVRTCIDMFVSICICVGVCAKTSAYCALHNAQCVYVGINVTVRLHYVHIFTLCVYNGCLYVCGYLNFTYKNM